MSHPDTESTTGILFVDDEEKARKYFEKAFGKKYSVFTAAGGRQGLELLKTQHAAIGLVVSDQRMPEMAGVDFLSQVRARYPDKIRILTTAYSDLDSAIRSVNEGRIYQYVTKPWDLQDFQMVLKRAADYYTILAERDHLMALKMSTLQRIVMADRLKTLSCIGRSGCLPEGDLLLETLVALVRQLPGTLNANPASGGRAMLHHGLARFMQQEQAATTITLRLWQEQKFDLEASISALESALAEKDWSASIDRTDDRSTLLITFEALESTPLCQQLYGTLCEAEPSALASAFLCLLASAKRNDKALTVRAGDAVLLSFQAKEQDSSNDLEELLAECYDRWDSESLGR